MISKRFSLLFFLKKSKNSSASKASIYLRITIDEQRAEISTKRFCDPRRWNSHTGRVNGTKEDARTINAYLDTIQSKVYEAHRNLIDRNELVTAEAVKNKLTGVTERPHLLMESFHHHNTQMKALIASEEYSQGTLDHFKTTYDHLSDFLNWKYNRTDVNVKKINYEFIADLEYFLKAEKKIAHNTAMKYLGDFKKIVLLCIKREWLLKDPFIGYKLTRKEVIKDFLVTEELEVIAAKKFATERLTVVRDIFLFSCYTGLAYADVQKLKRSEIVEGANNELWIITKRQKTNTTSRIPILPTALEIINWYKDNKDCELKGTVLPVLSNQKINSYLKEIADKCGIHFNLTFILPGIRSLQQLH